MDPVVWESSHQANSKIDILEVRKRTLTARLFVMRNMEGTGSERRRSVGGVKGAITPHG